jgi:hypothetical protein
MTTPFDRMLDLCEEYPEAPSYSKFDQIPSDLKSEGFLTAWIVCGAGSLKEVPVEERTEMMLRIAVSHDSNAFEIINPEDVSDYPALVLDAIENTPRSVNDIHPDFLTEELILKMAERRFSAISYLDFKGENKHLLTDNVISAFTSRNVASAVTFMQHIGASELHRVKDSDLTNAIQAQVNDLHQIKSIGKTHLLVDLLVAGYWPSNLNAAIKMQKHVALDIDQAPSTPHETLSRLAGIQPLGVSFLHLQSLRRFPIESVISTTQDIPKVVDRLLEVYSEKELKPHMRLSNALRGRLLETELGL